MFTRTALDLFFFREQPLELRIGLAQQRLGGRVFATVFGGAVGGRARVAVLGLRPPASARAHAPTDPRLPGGFTDRHRGFTSDLVLDRALVREDVALVDPDLHADAPESGPSFGEAVVDV